MMIFNELRKHGRLAAKRHPMYEKNKVAKIFGYIGVAFWAGYLIFFGTTFAFGFADMVPNREPYHVMNAVVLIFILALDFLLRVPFQKTPTQEVKPYLLLPVKRNRIIDFLLIRSGLSLFNLFWLFMFIPFSFITITKYFGILGVFTYLIGIWLLIVANNYWYLLCRTLINERIWWVLLPIAFYGGLGCLAFIPEDSPLFYFFMDLGDGYINGNILYFLGTILVIAILWLINRKIMSGLIYAELAKVDDTRIKHVSEYKFFERYGEVGEYMRLECVYNFAVFGMIILSQLMSFEGNYIDGLMSRKESIMSLLKAKYYIYTIGEVVPFMLMIPAIIMDKVPLLGIFAWFFYTTGFIYFCFFQLAVYNKQTVALNEKVSSRQTNSAIQMVVNFGAFGVPLILYSTLNALLGETVAYSILLVIGLGFTITSPLWIRNVYKRFMKRRYENMEGFRDSRQ